MTPSHPLSNKPVDIFPGILLPPKPIICRRTNPQCQAYKSPLSYQQALADLNVTAPMQVHTHMHGDRRLEQLKSMCHEPMWFSTRDENWCFKPSSSETASSESSEGCHLLTLQIFRRPCRAFRRHLLSLCRKVGSPLCSIQHLQQKEHTHQTPNTVLM